MILCKSYLVKAPRLVPTTTLSIRGIAAWSYRDKYYDYFISDNLLIEKHSSGIDYLNGKVRLTKESAKEYFVKSRVIY